MKIEIFLSSLLIFLLLVEADNTDRLESGLAKLNDETNYKFNTSNRVHNLREKRIDNFFNKLSGKKLQKLVFIIF